MTTWPGYTGTTTNLQIVLETQRNPYLNQATQKKYFQIFLPKKNPRIENFKPKKILRSSPSLEIRSTPLGQGHQGFKQYADKIALKTFFFPHSISIYSDKYTAINNRSPISPPLLKTIELIILNISNIDIKLPFSLKLFYLIILRGKIHFRSVFH